MAKRSFRGMLLLRLAFPSFSLFLFLFFSSHTPFSCLFHSNLPIKQKDIHTAIDQHPTPSYHSQIPYSHQHSSDEDKETGFQGMLDERTMAVRRKLNSVIGEKRRGFVAVLFGGSREIEGEGNEGVEVLRPARNRRWQF